MNGKTAKLDYVFHPTKEYIYFVCDPNDDTFYFRSADERELFTETILIPEYKDLWDNEWNIEVENIYAGTVTHFVTATNKVYPDGELDEYGMDEAGECWGDGYDFKCDYELKEIE